MAPPARPQAAKSNRQDSMTSSESTESVPTSESLPDLPTKEAKKAPKKLGGAATGTLEKAAPPGLVPDLGSSDEEGGELVPASGSAADPAAGHRSGGHHMVPVYQSRIKDREKKDEKESSLKIKIELDLEVEVELWARVKGDVTIGLL